MAGVEFLACWVRSVGRSDGKNFCRMQKLFFAGAVGVVVGWDFVRVLVGV
jgi:hypothetical protein